MEIIFEAIIKEVKSRTGADMDKTGRMVIEFIPTDENLDLLNKLHKPDETVVIKIKECVNNTQSIQSAYD